MHLARNDRPQNRWFQRIFHWLQLLRSQPFASIERTSFAKYHAFVRCGAERLIVLIRGPRQMLPRATDGCECPWFPLTLFAGFIQMNRGRADSFPRPNRPNARAL